MKNDDPERAAAVADENRRLRHLRIVVDFTSQILIQGRLSRAEAEALVAATRRRTLALFPDKEGTFDLILAPRFARLMAEFVGPADVPTKVLPFRKPAR